MRAGRNEKVGRKLLPLRGDHGLECRILPDKVTYPGLSDQGHAFLLQAIFQDLGGHRVEHARPESFFGKKQGTVDPSGPKPPNSA